jgi:hypothetical protein
MLKAEVLEGADMSHLKKKNQKYAIFSELFPILLRKVSHIQTRHMTPRCND